MPPHPEWPELLEEQAYLVQMLSEVVHDSGALENTRTLLDTLRADLRVCTMQVADLERQSRDSSPKRHDMKMASSASRFIHRVTGSIGSDKEKEKEKENYVLGEGDKHERLLAVWIKKRTLGAEVKNLEVRAQILQRQHRHYVELQRRLATLYARIPAAKDSPSREEEDAEEDTRRAQLTLHEVQRLLDRYNTLVALLQQGDYALVNAAHHLSAADSKGGSGIDAAKRCAVQTSVVVDQAKRIDPSFFEQEETQVLKPGWLAEVFRATANDQYADGPLLIQALKPHHTALASLISRAHKRTSEQDTVARRAARRYSDVRMRRDALKRRVMVMCATAEAEGNGEMSFVDQGAEKDGSTRMRDITVGLDGVIPVVVPPRGSVAAKPPTEEQPRTGQDKPVPPPPLPPLVSPQPRSPPQSLQLLSSTLLLDLASTQSSTPPSTTKSGIDSRTEAQFRSVDKKSRRASPAVHQTPSPNSSQTQPPPTDPNMRQRPSGDPTLGKPALLDSTTRTRQPSPRQSREAASGPQYDRQPVPSPLYESEITSTRYNGRHDAVPQAQAQPRQALPMRQDVPSLIVKQSSQQDAKTPQSSVLLTSILSTDSRLKSPASVPNVKPEPYQVPPRSSPQSQLLRKQPVPLGPLPTPPREPYPETRGLRPGTASPSAIAQVGKPQGHVASGSSRCVSDSPQVTSHIPYSAANPPPERPPVHGILKRPVAPAPRRPAPAETDTDPWGVRVATASSSRPQPKLKAMFHLWRSAEGFKHEEPAAPARPSAQPEPRPLSPKKENQRAAMQTLRFAEAVEVIPRPAIDSDPYEDEDEDNDEELPPSPRRGSVLWLQGQEGQVEESDDDLGGHGSTLTSTHTTTTRATVPSESSISSTSSLYSTGQSSQLPSPSSGSTTPPTSALSYYSDSSLASYYTAQKEDDMSMNNPTATSHPQQAPRQMSYGSVRSDHELIQSIFPSPPQSNISGRDLMFGP